MSRKGNITVSSATINGIDINVDSYNYDRVTLNDMFIEVTVDGECYYRFTCPENLIIELMLVMELASNNRDKFLESIINEGYTK